MKYYIHLLRYGLLVAFATGASGLCAEAERGEQPAATEFLQLQTIDQLQGDFRQEKSLRELPFPLVSRGSFRFSRGAGLHWHIASPIDSELFISSTGIRQSQDGREFLRLDSSEQPAVALISNIFFAVLGGDWTTLEQHFLIEHFPRESGWQARLTPRDNLLASFASAITLSGADYIDELTILETGGDATRIWFENVSGSN